MSGVFDFAPNSHVAEEIPPDEAEVVSMNGWEFTSRPAVPYRARFKLTLSGMRWFMTQEPPILNRDPETKNLYAWTGGTIVWDPTSPTGYALRSTSYIEIIDPQKISLDPTKDYEVRCWARSENLNQVFLMVRFFDASGNPIVGTDQPAGWPSTGSWHYYGLFSQPAPTVWTEYAFKFGPGQSAKTPTGAVSCQIGVITNYQAATPGPQLFTGMQLREVFAPSLDVTSAPPLNVGRLLAFYKQNRKWDTFTYNHEYLGQITCRFAEPVIIPKAAPNASGLVPPFEVILIHHNPSF